MLLINGKFFCEHCCNELPYGLYFCHLCPMSMDEENPTPVEEGKLLLYRYIVNRVLDKCKSGFTYDCFDLEDHTEVTIKQYFRAPLSDENMMENHTDALTNRTVLADRYSVLKILDKDDFGFVYMCLDLKDTGLVIVKEYFPDWIVRRDKDEKSVVIYYDESQEHFERGKKIFYDAAMFTFNCKQKYQLCPSSKHGAKLFDKVSKLLFRSSIKQNNPGLFSPSIPCVYDFFYENNTCYYVTSYFPGRDLEQYTDFKRFLNETDSKIFEEEVLYIALSVTDALIEIHNVSALHNEVSPKYIFICNNGDVKLLDLGIAGHDFYDPASTRLTFMNPCTPLERYKRKGNIGPWSDIYSLGASLYYVLTGNFPHDAFERMKVDVLNFDGISPEFSNVIKKMLAVRIEDRYQSALELNSALKALPIIPRRPQLFFTTILSD